MARRDLRERVELEKSVRRFRETFQGKVSLDLAVLLMKRYHSNYQLVTKHIVLMVTDQDSDGLDADDRREIENSPDIQSVIESLRAEETKEKSKGPKVKIKEDPAVKKVASRLSQQNLKQFNQANAKLIPWEEKQFACRQCDSYWWRRVPERKQGSLMECHVDDIIEEDILEEEEEDDDGDTTEGDEDSTERSDDGTGDNGD
ncbi:hypothetical protein scyTo_0006352 [Scyliorhinus torazame]|uniref:Uncharacterized protein n=1 Tax=Scyliorhinus torazame TaxID=75743 RepID=A0A401PHC9_SCYTO|nr:hypothetical protein [Scyliorhinus torazame]